MSTTGTVRSRQGRHRDMDMGRDSSSYEPGSEFRGNLKRHQLYDAPMPSPDILEAGSVRGSVASRPSFALSGRNPTIKFDSQDVVHQYHPTNTGDNTATHEHRSAVHSATLPPTPKPGESVDAFSQGFLPPVLEYDNGGLRSAPPVLTGLDTSDPYHRPRAENPFAGSPSTATLTSFPSISSITQATAGSSVRTAYDDDEVRDSRHHHSPHQHHRQYPRGDKDVDREESESLWHRSSSEDDDIPPNQGSIRLVPSGTSTKF